MRISRSTLVPVLAPVAAAPQASAPQAITRRQALFLRVDRATELPMLIVAIVFLVAIALPEVVELPDEVATVLDSLAWMIWGLFAFELVGKTYLAPDRKRYLMTHWLEVLTVLVPFLRPLRLLRVLVVGLRFWTEARTVLKQQTFGLIGIASILAVSGTASMVYLAERGGPGPIHTFSDALWWLLRRSRRSAMVTCTPRPRRVVGRLCS